MFSYDVDSDITLVMQSLYDAEKLMPVINANRVHIGEYLGWVDGASSIERLTQYLHRDLRGMVTGVRNAWLIYYHGELVGRIGMWVSDPSVREFELHYWLAEDATGKGVMSRCVACILDYAFGELGLEHAMIITDEHNIASHGVAERLGFTLEIEKREEMGADHPQVMCHYGLLRDEWYIKSDPIFALRLNNDIELRLTEVHHARRAYDLISRNADDLSQWFDWMNNGHTLMDERAFIRLNLERYATGEGMRCRIVHRGQYVGAITIGIDVDDRKAQLGYYLDVDARRQGIMTIAIRGMLSYAFETLALERIWIRVATDNEPNHSLAEKLGFMRELVLREEQVVAGRRVSHVVYSMLRDEWLTRKETHIV